MGLAEKRWRFCSYLTKLEIYAAGQGFLLVRDEGRVFQKRKALTSDGKRITVTDRVHIPKSKHYEGLAQDYILYDQDWKPIEVAHIFWTSLGNFWKSLAPECTWGGDWEKLDLGHFSYEEH